MTLPHHGYTLSSEEHGPATLVANARAAEAAGFDHVTMHIHQVGPDQQPFIQVARDELLPRLRGH